MQAGAGSGCQLMLCFLCKGASLGFALQVSPACQARSVPLAVAAGGVAESSCEHVCGMHLCSGVL